LGAHLLHVLREVEDGVAARRPSGHLEIQMIRRIVLVHQGFDLHLEEMRRGARHRETIIDGGKRRRRVRLSPCDRAKNKDESRKIGRAPNVESVVRLHKRFAPVVS
jgi:hypothetical protein